MPREADDDDRSFLEIDRNQLEVEWDKQPNLYDDWAEKLAEAEYDHDEAKRLFELAEAELEKDVRDAPLRYGCGNDKPSNPEVKAAVIRSKKYQSAYKGLNKAKHRQKMLQAIVTALEHRKKGLEKQVDLHGQGYFSVPRASKRNAEDMDEERARRTRKGRRRNDY